MTQTSTATPDSDLRDAPENPEEVATTLGPGVADSGGDSVDEVERLEALLFARTRSHGCLQQEIERRDRLFREALVRISTSTSQEFSALRAGYDAAVSRAIEAEVARAELTFALDETRAQLTAATPVGAREPLSAQQPERTESQRAALAHNAAHSELQRRIEALRGEHSGLRARLADSERAWQGAVMQAHKAEQRCETSQSRVDALRAESAELTLLAETRAARIAELSQAAALDLQEIRTLRAQVVAATAAQVAHGEAREADRQLWAERVLKHEEREHQAWSAAASAVARSETRLREFLGTLEAPLRDLDASLARDPNDAQPENAETPSARFDVSGEARAATGKPASTPAARRIADELAQERDRRTKLVATVKALQAATQSGEPTKPWIEELVELVTTESRPSAPSARRRS